MGEVVGETGFVGGEPVGDFFLEGLFVGVFDDVAAD